MIHSFSCKNFYSFGKEVKVDFTVNDNAPKDNGYFKAKSGTRLSKTEAVIGPNASGKTNLLKVLPFIKWFIVDSFKSDPDELMPIKPFAFTDKKDPIEISVVFEIQKKVYTYILSLTAEKILSEELKCTSFVKQKKSRKKIFSRTWDEKEKKYLLSDTNFNLPKGFKKTLRKNASVISTAMQFEHDESHSIGSLWERQVETNIVEAGWIGDKMVPDQEEILLDTFEFYTEHENKMVKKEMEKIIHRFDIGLSEINIKKEGEGDDFFFKAHSARSIKKKKYKLPLNYESSGTKQLLVLLKSILAVLENGGIAVIDEIDVNLHPEIIIEIVDLFVHPETNPKNAQIFFSTHSHLLIQKLSKYQLILTEKDEHGISDAYRLDEIKGVRIDDNLYTKYLAGAYGAVPNFR